ncbi:MAG: winged helix-turn-helix transcriptional regulator, partial [Pseudomonadota bacterium]
LARTTNHARKKMLTERLRQLVGRGLVSRTVADTAPVTVHYAITPFGETALGFLDQLRAWSEALPESDV